MDCTEIAASTGWECAPAGIRAIRATSPLTLGEDGHHAAFYIATPSDGSFFLTDASETAMHAEQHGVALSKKRFHTLNRTFGVGMARFADDGSIVAEGSVEKLQSALWDAVKLAMSLSFKTPEWRPKFAQAKFQATVFQVLQAQLGAELVIKDAKIQGASGNQIAFPIAVKRADGNLSFIQPIALENEKLNWAVIYQAHGKFFDVMAASEINNRMAIIEDGAKTGDFGRAANFLRPAAEVRTLLGTPSWRNIFH